MLDRKLACNIKQENARLTTLPADQTHVCRKQPVDAIAELPDLFVYIMYLVGY